VNSIVTKESTSSVQLKERRRKKKKKKDIRKKNKKEDEKKLTINDVFEYCVYITCRLKRRGEVEW